MIIFLGLRLRARLVNVLGSLASTPNRGGREQVRNLKGARREAAEEKYIFLLG
jgi:hypothetical protein